MVSSLVATRIVAPKAYGAISPMFLSASRSSYPSVLSASNIRFISSGASASSPSTSSPAAAPSHTQSPDDGFESGNIHHFKDTQRQHTVGEDKPVYLGKNSVPSRPDEDWVLFHPVYTAKEVESVKIAVSPAERLSEKIAALLVRTLRKGFDLVTGYKHASPEEAIQKLGAHNMSLEELRKKGIVMTPGQWLMRILFLESIAGVPGFVGATLRHLRSLRLMRRDGGWIHTLLEESENERMHLMTFVKISNPGWFFRLVILGAQGVFYNALFVSYMLSPRACHSFVGKLEEEAVKTYTHALGEIDAKRLPEWDKVEVPRIARDYWRLSDKASIRDLILVVRADEANHRFVNNTLSHLPHDAENPFAMHEPDGTVKGQKAGFTYEESMAWSEKVRKELKEKMEKAEEKRA